MIGIECAKEISDYSLSGLEGIQDSNTKEPLKDTFLSALLKEAESQSVKLETTIQELDRSLDVSYFWKTQSRFISRQLPSIWLKKAVLDLLTWKKTSNTVIFLLSFTLVCFHPILFAVLPQAGILFVIFKFYKIRRDQFKNGALATKPHQYGTPPKISLSASETKDSIQNVFLN
jgi:hypothetical protein